MFLKDCIKVFFCENIKINNVALVLSNHKPLTSNDKHILILVLLLYIFAVDLYLMQPFIVLIIRLSVGLKACWPTLVSFSFYVPTLPADFHQQDLLPFHTVQSIFILSFLSFYVLLLLFCAMINHVWIVLLYLDESYIYKNH